MLAAVREDLLVTVKIKIMIQKLSKQEQENCYNAFKELMPNELEKAKEIVEKGGFDLAWNIINANCSDKIPDDAKNVLYNAMLYISEHVV